MRANADALAAGLIGGGFDVLTGGTDTHLVQLDLRATEWTGLAAQDRLDECRLTVNRNTVPFDERPPMVASGVRIGTPAATMRGFDEDDFARGRPRSSSARSRTTPTSRRSPARSLGALRPPAALPGLPRLHDLRRVSIAPRRRPSAAPATVSDTGTWLRDRR